MFNKLISLRIILIYFANIFESTTDGRKKMFLTIIEHRVEYRKIYAKY